MEIAHVRATSSTCMYSGKCVVSASQRVQEHILSYSSKFVQCVVVNIFDACAPLNSVMTRDTWAGGVASHSWCWALATE